jgi:hypothetical protein
MEIPKVYLLSSIINEELVYKIGFTTRKVSERLNELKTGNPSINFIQEYHSSNSRKIETILHRIYNHKRINREWFNLSKDEVDDFLNRCQLIDYNLKIIEQQNDI